MSIIDTTRVTVAPSRVRSALRSSPVGAVALAYLAVLILLGVLAPVVSPHDPAKQNLVDALSGPSATYWLGTDFLGRDIFSMLLHGIVPSLGYALIALVVFVALGVPLGIVAGYRGGALDTVISRLAEIALSIPAIIIILVVLAVFSSSPTAAMVAMGVLASPGLIRVARGATLVVRDDAYVTAAIVSGVSPLRIMTSHIARRIVGPILVQATVFAGAALVVQAALAFLGLLASGGRPTWGGMVGDAAQVISLTSWPLFPPGLAIAVTVLALGLVGDAVRDSASDQDAAPRGRVRTQPAPAAAPATRLGNHLLTVEGLRVALDDGTLLVSDATFSLDAGETLAVVGESGCGKSMTALAVLGLLPPGVHVASGRVLLDGVDLVAGGPQAYSKVRGSELGYVAQDALGSLDPTATVGAHLREVVIRHEKLASAALKARAVELLDQVQIPDPERVLRLYPHEISGGMAQRVNIALALAGRPRVLIADEPTTALDVTVQAEILALLRSLQDEYGMGIVIITHNWGVVADLADRAVVMYAGEVVESGDVTELFHRPRFPYTAALLAADPSTAEAGSRLPTIPGRVPPPGQWPDGCRFADRCPFVTDQCRGQDLPLTPVGQHSVTRCVRVDDLVLEGTLPR